MERDVVPTPKIDEVGASRLELANKQALEMDKMGGQLSQADLDRFTAESIQSFRREREPELSDKVVHLGKQAVELVITPLRKVA